MKQVILSNIKFNRSVFKAEGILEELVDSDISKFYIKDSISEEIIEFDTYTIIENKFKLHIPLLAIKEEYPLTNGEWYLYVETKNNEEICLTTSDYVYDKVHLNKYDGDDIDAIYDKSAKNYFHCYSRINLNDKSFYFVVDYKVPVVVNNIFIIWKRNVVKRHKKRVRKVMLFGFKMLFKIFNSLPKKGNKVLFTSASRGEIGGNEKFVYDRMIERGMNKEYKIRFDFKDNIKSRRTTINKFKFTYYVATSDYIFMDDYQPEIYKNDYDKSVKIIQLWHACGAFKTIGFERIGAKGSPKFNTKVHKCYTHVIVSSDHSGMHNAEAFAISEKKFYPVGIPRTDIFFNEQYKIDIVNKIYEVYPQLKQVNKVITYAPTFRGKNAKDAYFPMHMIDFEKIGKYLKEVNGIMILKMHPFVKNEIEVKEEYQQYFINASEYREINDLLFITDVLITDYSSVIYEMSLLRKPVLFYAFDIDTYEKDRGFYEPFKEIVSGKIVKTTDQLIESLTNEDYELDKLEEFLEKNFKYTDGKSTDRVIDLVFNNKISE